MNINDFKGSYKSLARPTRFRVYGFGADRQLEFMCKGAQIPGSQIGTIEVPYMARKIKEAGDRTYTEWTITIINDISFNLHEYFEKWLEKINHPSLNVGVGNPLEYKEDGFVDQLDMNGEVVATYQLIGAFPIEVSPIELSWESTDSIEEFTVNFAYDWHERIK